MESFEIEEFNKPDFNLVAWLKAFGPEVGQRFAAWIATRISARALPVLMEGLTRNARSKQRVSDDPRIVLILRCLLTSGVGAFSLTLHIRKSAYEADIALSQSDRSTGNWISYLSYSAALAVRTVNARTGVGDTVLDRAIQNANEAGEYAKAGIFEKFDTGVDVVKLGYPSPSVAQPVLNTLMDQIEADTQISGEKYWMPLWSGTPPDWFLATDKQMRKVWASDPNENWDFWTRWWDGLVAGQPLDWALQEKVALIPDDIWQQGPAAVARAIREIEEQDSYNVSQATRAKAEKLLRAAIGTFTFDQVRGLITLGPFAEDLAFIKQPEVIDRFLAAAADVRERIDALQRSFEREGRGMQGAATLLVYLGKVDEEFSKARQVQLLRVGTLLNWVNILRTIAVDDSTRREISPLHVPLDDLLNGLDDLIRTYFAQALVRVAPLKDIRSDENVPLADLLQDIRRGMDVIRASEGKELVPLAPEVIAIFDDTLADLDLLVRAELSEPLPARRSALRREFDFQWAQIVVSWLLYREASIKNAGWAVDALSSWGAKAGHVLNLRELIQWVIGFFTSP